MAADDSFDAEVCRCCWSPEPRTIDGRFMMEMCRTCFDAVDRRVMSRLETLDEGSDPVVEAIEHYEEIGVWETVRRLRAEAENRPVPTEKPDSLREVET